VAHPPGQPVALLAGKACALVPLGSVAFRVGLASSLAGAGAAAQTARLGRAIARRVGLQAGRAADFLGAAAGLAFALSYAAAFQAVRPEVYALSALCVLTAVVELERFDADGDRRRLYLAALAGGLALANHHLLAFAVLVPGLGFALARRPARPVGRAAARVLAAGALGLTAYAYLPLRAARHPLVDWGAPTTWSRFYWTVSAQAFQKSVARGSSSDAAEVVGALAAQLHPLGLLLALGGLYVLLRMPSLRRVGLLLAAASVLDALAPALVGFDVANPDAYGYLEAAVALLAALACALPAAVAARLRRRAAAALAGALAALAVGWGALGWPRIDRAAQHDAATVSEAWLGTAPPRATVVTSYFQTIFALYYLRGVEGQRPDVDLVHRHFLAYPGYRDELLHRRPALAPALGPRDVDPFALPEPLVVEYDLDLPAPLVPRSHAIPVENVDLDEPQTRRFAAWQRFLAAHRACRLGDRAAPAALASARALLGDSPELAALAASCPTS
jgi:hypothetical protein